MIKLYLAIHLLSQLAAPGIDPDLVWKTRSTQNFRIHYPTDLEEIALRYQATVEPIREKIIGDMKWTPSGPVHLVLLNNTDSANGLSTPLPYNTIYLHIAPPSPASSLDNYDDWLTMLFVHEYTHTIHIDMVHGFNRFFRSLFGRSILPNAVQPQWLVEGYAIFNETNYTTQGRGRSSFVEMQLREAALQDLWPSISRATYWNNQYPYGQTAYWYGIGFYQYIEKIYGAEVWAQFAEVNSRWIVPGWFNFKTKSLLGKSFSRLWEEWRLEQISYWNEEKAKYQTKTQFQPFNEEKLKVLGQSCWAPKSQILYAVVEDLSKKRSLRAWTRDVDSGAYRSEILSSSFPAVDLTCDSNRILFAKISPVNRYNQYSDLWEFDLTTKKQKQLTFSERLSFPSVSGERTFAVQSVAFRSRIVEVLPDAPSQTTAIKIVYEPEGLSQISQLQVSPDSKRILFSMKRESEFSDLFILNLDTKKIEALTQNERLEYFPQWINDREVLYVADYPLPQTQSRVFNVFRQKIGEIKATAITDSWSGIFWPLWIDGKLSMGRFEKEGFDFDQSQVASLFEVETRAQPARPMPPPILSPAQTTEASPETAYRVGNTLLPRYVFPFVYLTNQQLVLGGLTGSNDPLGLHRWYAAGYYVSGPQRPAGSLLYLYSGISPITLSFGAQAGLINYGKVLLKEQGNQVRSTGQDYYERNYVLSSSLSYSLWSKGKALPIGLAHGLSFLDRRSLLKLDSAVLRDTVALEDGRSVKAFPDTGQQLRLSSRFFWGSSDSEWLNFASRQTRQIYLDLEYSPKIFGLDFHTLTTSFSLREFLSFGKRHRLGLYSFLGIQWLDQLYQSTFRLGGSIGEGGLGVLNQKSLPLRGLPLSFFRGEGVLAGSLEYEWQVWDTVPGWGTAPIWFKDFGIAVFQDFGQAFFLKDSATAVQMNPQNFSFKRFSNSLGIELRSQTSMLYGPPILFRLGYAQMMYLQGQWILGDQLKEIYFQIGSSF
jgi:hypothetical protein